MIMSLTRLKAISFRHTDLKLLPGLRFTKQMRKYSCYVFSLTQRCDEGREVVHLTIFVREAQL